jgi:CHAD domain-containing protein
MAATLKSGESVGAGMRRVARKETSKALEQLQSIGDDADEAVHDARKRFKRIRALLKLVRCEIGEKSYQRENARFRDAGRPLTEVRDARILLDTLDDLVKRLTSKVPKQSLAAARRTLQEHYEEVKRRVLDEQPAVQDIVETVCKGKRRAKRWPIGRGWRVLKAGLAQGYKRARQAYSVATKDSTPENLHECRKRAKDWWHQLEFLDPIQPRLIRRMAQRMHDLADALGDDHDLHVLEQFLSSEPRRKGMEKALAILAQPIAHRRSLLQERAMKLGGKQFAPAPRRLLRRLQSCWRRWQDGPPVAKK